MFQWKTLRLIAAILIALPLLHLAYTLGTGAVTYLEPTPETWSPAMEAVIEADMDLALPERPILVVGGQRVRLWRDLPDRLAPRPVLLRPLGDATIEDIRYHYDRLVGHYRPDTLVIVPGYAELHLRDSKTAAAFVRAARELLATDEAYGVTRQRILLTPMLMPLHPEDDERVRAIGAATLGLAATLPNLLILDPNELLTRADGRPNPDYYLSDGINLNSEGYARVTLMLEQAIDATTVPVAAD